MAIIKFDWADSGDEMLTQFSTFGSICSIYAGSSFSHHIASHRDSIYFIWFLFSLWRAFLVSFQLFSNLFSLECWFFFPQLIEYEWFSSQKLTPEQIPSKSLYDYLNNLKCCRFTNVFFFTVCMSICLSLYGRFVLVEYFFTKYLMRVSRLVLSIIVLYK